MTSPSDEYNRLGFKADEIYPFLERHGITLARPDGPIPSVIEKLAEATFPNWKHVLAAHHYLTDKEAACAFADVDPHAPGYTSNDEDAEIWRYRTLITRAILSDDHGERLDAEPIEFDSRDNPTEWKIKPAALAAWCARKRLEYPLPGGVSVQAPDAELVERLRGAEADRVRLMQEVAELSAVADERANLRKQVSALTAKTRELSDSLDAANMKIQELSGGQAQGKSRSKMLQVIGALAIDTYRVDIHASRMTNFGDMLSAIQAAGADVQEDTLRVYLKEAAAFITKKPDIR